MLLSLGLVLLILGIALFQATQGFFSALLMVVLTVCCAAFAFGTFEYVAQNWLAPLWKPDFAYSIALGLLFAVPLFALRLTLDRVVPRSNLIPAMIDRLGGGICGLITALICVGVLACSILWLPHGTGFLGFARVDVPAKTATADGPTPTPPNADAPMRELLMTPDRFAVTVAGMLSDGLFSGSQRLTESHPDLVLEFGESGAAPPEVLRYAPPNSISFSGTEIVQNLYKETPATSGGGGRRGSQDQGTAASVEPLSPKAGHEFRLVRITLKKEAKDERKSHVFTLRQIRLIGRTGPDEPTQIFHAIALQQRTPDDTIETVNRHIRIQKTGFGDWHIMDDPYSPRARNDDIEVVFEVPKGFVPEFVDYKRGARAAVTFDKGPNRSEEGAAAPDGQPADSDRSSGNAEGSRRRRGEPSPAPETPQGGNVKRYTVRTGKSFFGDQTPLPLKAYSKPTANVEARREALVAGHLIAYIDEQESGTNEALTKFFIPEDKRLLQLNTGYLQARSGLGRALSFAVETLQNYQVGGDNGQVYEVVGKFAIADVDGRQVCEMQYFSEKMGTIGQLGPFNKIKNSHLKGEYEYVLLFLVDPGVTITSFSTGGAASRQDDLRAEGLVAPN